MRRVFLGRAFPMGPRLLAAMIYVTFCTAKKNYDCPIHIQICYPGSDSLA